MEPDAGRTNPLIASMSVDLPAPLGPMRPTISPGETVSDTPSTAVTPPNRTVSPLIRRVWAGTAPVTDGSSGPECAPGTATMSGSPPPDGPGPGAAAPGDAFGGPCSCAPAEAAAGPDGSAAPASACTGAAPETSPAPGGPPSLAWTAAAVCSARLRRR